MILLRELGPNFRVLEVNQDLKIWFSYETPIAFRLGREYRVSENLWGSTTGKHLNQLQDKSHRISRQEFLEQLAEVERLFQNGTNQV